MRLLVDIGNQRLKWSLLSSDVPARSAAVQTALSQGSQVTTVKAFFDGVDGMDAAAPSLSSLEKPESVWMSSVSTSETTDRFIEFCQERWGVLPSLARSAARYKGLENRYDRPAQLGVDRWLAAVAAYAMCGREQAFRGVIVVDAGTAVTADVVHDDAFLGGAILPGVKLITEALGNRTGRIRLDSENLAKAETGSHDRSVNQDFYNTQPLVAECFTGTNSNDAVEAGAFAAICGGVRHCVEAALSRFGLLPVVVCGGDGALVAASLQRDQHFLDTGVTTLLVPDLVLQGLALSSMEEGAR